MRGLFRGYDFILVGKSVFLDVIRPQPVRKMEIKLFKEQCPLHLPWIKLFNLLYCEEILIVRPDYKWFTTTLEPVRPLFQHLLMGRNCKDAVSGLDLAESGWLLCPHQRCTPLE